MEVRVNRDSGKQSGSRQSGSRQNGSRQSGTKQSVTKQSGSGGREREKKSAVCPVAGKCGGCRWIDRTYEEQLREKERRFAKLIAPFCKAEPMIGMENPAHYRNKVHAVFGEDRKHNIISGIYESGSHRIVPVDSCYIENEKADAIIVTVRELLRSFKIRPYNEDTGYGLLRHVLIRTGAVTGQIMVVLVLASPILPSKNHFVKALREKHPEITTIVVNVNGRGTSMVLGDKEQVVYGKGYIEDELCGKMFRISSKSFYQVNPVQTQKLYERALEYAGLTGRETVLDAYCGTGTIGILAADRAGEVLGVELNGDAVRDARINAKRNGTENIRFYQNDAGRFLTNMAGEGQGKVDVLFMDPPRAGSDEAFLNAVVRMKPRRVVYISCNPDTLVRDIKYLVKHGGYRVKRAGAVDMFPFADATEAVCLLEGREEIGLAIPIS